MKNISEIINILMAFLILISLFFKAEVNKIVVAGLCIVILCEEIKKLIK